MTLDVKPKVAAAVEALASARGLSVAEYLEQIVERELPSKEEDGAVPERSGMVWEDGLFVYRNGTLLPVDILDDAIRRAREERARHILGDIENGDGNKSGNSGNRS